MTRARRHERDERGRFRRTRLRSGPAPAEVVTVFGRRGSGKTTRARLLTSTSTRLVVFDPLGEYAGAQPALGLDPGVPAIAAVGTLAELRARIAWSPRAFRLAYQPGGGIAGDLVGELHRLAVWLWQLQDLPCSAGARLTLLVDEMSLSYPVTALPRNRWGIRQLVLQGRHRRIGLVGVAQRPSLVSLDFRSQAHRALFFALPSRRDQQAALEQLGEAWRGGLLALGVGQYLEAHGGQVRRGGR